MKLRIVIKHSPNFRYWLLTFPWSSGAIDVRKQWLLYFFFTLVWLMGQSSASFSVILTGYVNLHLLCFVFNWRHCTVKTRKLGQSPIRHYLRSSAHWRYFRQFLTRLVHKKTLHNDCNLIPSAQGTQHLSSQSDHWTKGSLHWGFLFKGPFQRGEMRVEDAQLLPRVVAGT